MLNYFRQSYKKEEEGKGGRRRVQEGPAPGSEGEFLEQTEWKKGKLPKSIFTAFCRAGALKFEKHRQNTPNLFKEIVSSILPGLL